MVATTLKELNDDGLISMHDSILEATLLGQAIVASSLTPEDGMFVHKELKKALQAFVMDGDVCESERVPFVGVSYTKLRKKRCTCFMLSRPYSPQREA